jgi:hypothetical protein
VVGSGQAGEKAPDAKCRVLDGDLPAWREQGPWVAKWLQRTLHLTPWSKDWGKRVPGQDSGP